jgi:type II secretory pathway pseudopilin PulG
LPGVDCGLQSSVPELETPSLRLARAPGFTLLEVLVATTLLFVGVAALAGLSIMATRANTAARASTFASLLAAQKMEELRSPAWGYDALGQPRSDLTPSPADALTRNTTGYCDFLDAAGRLLGGGPSPPAQAVFVRRWSIEPLPSNPANALTLQVVVTRVRTDQPGAVSVLTDEASLVTVRTRSGS